MCIRDRFSPLTGHDEPTPVTAATAEAVTVEAVTAEADAVEQLSLIHI